MNERLAFIRAKYEQRSFFGPPSAATLRAAAADCELRLEQLPAGYLDGVEHLAGGGGGAAGGGSGAAATAAAATAASADAAAAVNPAVARRLAKKREEEEAARAASDAAAAAAAAVSQSQLGDSEWPGCLACAACFRAGLLQASFYT